MNRGNPYAVLGVPRTADDAAIHARYLQLVREYPPEQHPARFSEVRDAYNTIRDFDSRVRLRLFPSLKDDSLEAISEELACRTPRPRIGLKALTAMLPALPR